MQQKLKEQNVMITGASGGLGERIAYHAAKEGAEIILAARRRDRLMALKQNIADETGAKCRIIALDVSRTDDIKAAFQEAGPVDILVNNAGFGIFESALDASLEDMKAMFEVNVFGLIACTKMALPHMIRQDKGHIINIASQAGKLATPKSSLYAATKHAVLGYSNSLRMELAETGVNVTTVNPGPIQTDFSRRPIKEGIMSKTSRDGCLIPIRLLRKSSRQ